MTVEELFDILYHQYGEEFNWSMIAFNNRFFVEEAKKEIKIGHDLFGKVMYSVAKCDYNDDVLFVTGNDKNEDLYIIIHLTYNNNNDTDYPKYTILGGLKEVREYLENQCR